MSRRFFLNAPGWCLAGLLTCALSGCGDAKRLRALAGTYVKVHDEDNYHSRLALTLREDNHWTSASEEIMGGKDLLAGGRSGDAIVPPGYTDSGTFAHGNYWRPLSVFGSQNTSHGCVGLHDVKGGGDPNTPAAWFYNNSLIGDVVQVVNSPDKVIDPGNGLNGWNMSWAVWKAN